MSDEIRIDWASAEVEDGRLTVPFTGAPPPGFKDQVSDVIRRLDHGGGWGEVKVAKSKLRVADVQEGAEPDLRHFLESAVLQANANLADDEDHEDTAGAEPSEADRGMTERFRAFAPPES